MCVVYFAGPSEPAFYFYVLYTLLLCKIIHCLAIICANFKLQIKQKVVYFYLDMRILFVFVEKTEVKKKYFYIFTELGGLILDGFTLGDNLSIFVCHYDSFFV